MRISGIFLLLAVVIGGAIYYTQFLKAETVPNFRTAEAQQGDLRIEIKANGTLEPEEVVDVGAQVMGRIQELGEDPRGKTDPTFEGKRIDYCSDVEEGTILAQIDPSLYKATFDQADASLQRAKADLLQMEAKLVQTDAEWKRAQRLRELKLPSLSGIGGNSSPSGQAAPATTIKGISDSDFVLAKANYEVAKANVDVGRAAVDQQKALLASAKQNLEYTTISSPVKGTIIDRRVNIGQTVVASLNAPSLFLIAKDLRRMEIWTSVNEADIGRMKVGMPVRFSVDAFPGEFFQGRVKQVRLNASMTSNVVLYTVVVSAGNDDMRLLPYLTADVRFEVDQRSGVLLVPNAALRYHPRDELVLAQEDQPAGSNDEHGDDGEPGDEGERGDEGQKENGQKEGGEKSAAKVRVPELKTASNNPAKSSPKSENQKTVWIRHGDGVYPIDVEIGATDGAQTEIVAGDLRVGMLVVLGENQDEPGSTAGETNPFAPPRIRGTKSLRKQGM